MQSRKSHKYQTNDWDVTTYIEFEKVHEFIEIFGSM